MKTTMSKEEVEREMRRFQLIQDFAQIDEQTREVRVDRYLEIDRQRIIGDHYFARASTECIELYRDGHFISTVMTTQAVNEGILKFVSDRNNIDYENITREDLLTTLLSNGIFSKDCFEASKQIVKSFRNDVHHMNPKVATIDFPKLAKKNIHNLSVVEREVFEVSISNNGELIPKHPKYWDINPDGTVPIYLRMGI